MMDNKKENKILPVFAVSALIGTFLMIFASALQVELSNPSNANPEQGEIVSFIYSMKIYDGEKLGGDIEVHREGDLCLLCKTNIYGASLGCEGAQITRISEKDNYINQHETRVGTNSGGVYSNTEYTYNITINTSNLDLERYDIFVRAENLYKVFETDTKSFIVKETAEKNQTNETCTENWVCTGWSSCIENIQTRTCNDLNSCNTAKNKPSETQYCIQNQIVSYSGGLENLTSDLDINFEINSSSNGNIDITRYRTTESLNLTNMVGLLNLEKWFEINLIENSTDSLDYIIIKVSYTNEEISGAGIDESSLRLYYYNETSGNWEKYDGENGGVNAEENYVWAKTNHLSLWGVYGSAVVVQPVSSEGGGGGGSSKGITYLKNNNQSVQKEETTINADDYPKFFLNETKPKEETNAEVEKENRISEITGAVVGFTKTKTGIGLIFGAVIIAAGIWVLTFKKKKELETG